MAQMTKMSQARARLMLKHPFFATLVLSTPWREDKSIPTAATDGKYMYYNPEFMDSLSIDEIQFVLAHESAHVMFKHTLRVGSRDHMLYNIAADYAINYILLHSGFTGPKDKAGNFIGMYDTKYADMSAEQIYIELLKDAKKAKSSAAGKQLGPDDLKNPPDMSPEEAAKLDREINQRVIQATQIARFAGKIPKMLERLLGDLLDPVITWQEYLRQYMTQMAKDDTSWLRRNKNYQEYFLPARYSEKMGDIIFIADTSGSISHEDMNKVATEIAGCAEQVKPELIRVVYCDAAVGGEETFEVGEQIVLHPKGGGGTDMRVALEYVEKYDPIVVVLLTDGYTPWPVDTQYPLIVCCTTNAPVPVGTVIRM